jgi:sugar phosphate isomerase/epimerase
MTYTDLAISLDMVNRHYQEPNRNRYESRYYWEELYELIAAAGFRAIEIPFEPVWNFGGRSGVPFTQYTIAAKYRSVDNYLALLRARGIERVAGVHFNPNLFMRNDSLDFYFGATGHFAGLALEHAVNLGAGYFNLSMTPAHGLVQHHHPDMHEVVPGFIDRTLELVRNLADRANGAGIKLSLRSEYWSLLRGEAIEQVAARLPADALFDIDTANLHISGVNLPEFISRNAHRIGSVHLTDTDFEDSDGTWKKPNPEFPASRATQVFRDIGHGSVDLQGSLRALEDAHYAGEITVSCRQTRDPMRALLRARSWLNKRVAASH